MLLEKKLAQAIKLIFKLHEESWDKKEEKYTKSMENCCIEGCEQFGISEAVSYIVYLAVDSWPNDADGWADNMFLSNEIDN